MRQVLTPPYSGSCVRQIMWWFFLPLCLAISVMSLLVAYETAGVMDVFVHCGYSSEDWIYPNSGNYFPIRRKVVLGLACVQWAGLFFWFGWIYCGWTTIAQLVMAFAILLNVPAVLTAIVLFSQSECCWLGRMIQQLKKKSAK